MLTAVLVLIGVAVLIASEWCDVRWSRAQDQHNREGLEALRAAGIAGVPSEAQAEQPIAPEILRAARRYGPGFPREIALVGIGLIAWWLLAIALGINDGKPGGHNVGIAGGVAVAVVAASAVRSRWVALALAAVLVSALAVTVSLPVRPEGPMTVRDAYVYGAGTKKFALSAGQAAALRIGATLCAAAMGFAAWHAMFASPTRVRRRLWSVVVAVPMLALVGYWWAAGTALGVIGTIIAWAWMSTAMDAVTAYWGQDVLRKSGWGALLEQQPHLSPQDDHDTPSGVA